MDASAIKEIAARHPLAFRSSFWKHYSAPIGILACILYTLYCWWFFSVGAVLQHANWRLAGAYLADWVSYEIRPDIEFQNGYLTIGYSRFSELGANPNPDWVIKEMATIERQVEARPAPAAGGKARHGFLHGPGRADRRKRCADSGRGGIGCAWERARGSDRQGDRRARRSAGSS